MRVVTATGAIAGGKLFTIDRMRTSDFTRDRGFKSKVFDADIHALEIWPLDMKRHSTLISTRPQAAHFNKAPRQAV